MNQNSFFRLDQRLRSMPKVTVAFLTLSVLIVISIPDFLVGLEISLLILYMFPIFIATMYVNRHYGNFIAIISRLPDIANAIYLRKFDSNPLLTSWDVILPLSTLLFIVVLIDRLRVHLENEAALARTDPVTGLFNRYAFIERLKYQIDLMGRETSPMALAYIDLDNFKQVNDRWGHAQGDKILCAVAHALRAATRKTDTVARLGGDEFAVIVHNADPAQAENLIRKMKSYVAANEETNQYRVTCSIGCVTFAKAPQDIDEAIKAADSLMYVVKRDGKDGIRVQQYG